MTSNNTCCKHEKTEMDKKLELVDNITRLIVYLLIIFLMMKLFRIL